MRKKSKLPDNLYHFTSLVKYRIILESGKLALTPSNLKFDPDTFHYEPNTTLTALRWLHSSSQHPITQTGTSVNRRFLWPTLPRLNFWIRTDFTRKRIRFLDSRLRMWRRSCLRKRIK